MTPRESAGVFWDGTPYLRLGRGPALVSVPGLTPDHELPSGWMRRMALAHVRPWTDEFTVYVVNRKPGLRAGESMSDIAGHLADVIERDLDPPVFLEGTSTGGSVVLQLAVDRPDLVRRLVVVDAAYRLGPTGRELQAEAARLIRDGKSREAWATVMTAMMPGPVRGALRGVAPWTVGRLVAADSSDALVTLDAEDAFDVAADLSKVTAPTLVIGGSEDRFYSERLFRDTAAGVPDGRAHIFPGWGHLRAGSSTATAHLTLGFMLADTATAPVRAEAGEMVGG